MNGGDEVIAAPAGPPQPLEWKFSQVFGERTAGEEVQEGILDLVLKSIISELSGSNWYIVETLVLGFVFALSICFGSWVAE